MSTTDKVIIAFVVVCALLSIGGHSRGVDYENCPGRNGECMPSSDPSDASDE